MQLIEEKYHDKAITFIQELSNLTIPSSRYIDGRVLCRGHGNYKWSLTPKILRDKEILLVDTGRKGIVKSEQIKTEKDLVVSEILLIEKFLNGADRIGETVPGDSLNLRRQLTLLKENLKNTHVEFDSSLLPWPNPEILQILALMQHSGLPTRLLDWTRIPLHAAYFAVKQAIDNNLDDGYLAVYIMDSYIPTDWKSLEESDSNFASNRLILVAPPTAHNANMVSQSGLFTMNVRNIDAEIGSRSQRNYIEKERSGIYGSKVYLLKHSEKYELLFWLRDDGIDNSQLFRSWNGIAESINEEIAWYRQSHISQ